jgi:hypothetical protein
MDNFISIVEARVNRALRVAKMSVRATLDVEEDKEYYGFPIDFGGLRDIQYTGTEGPVRTLKYMSPEQMNNLTNIVPSSDIVEVYYTIVAQQLQIFPPKATGTIEIIYYQKLDPLSGSNLNNWLGDTNPDCYVFGILVEISSFVKSKEATALWDLRFKEVLGEVLDEDAKDRWSGTSLQTRIG